MKSLFLALSLIVVNSVETQAKIWRVNNNGYSADFATLELANSNPNVGVDPAIADTIHLEGSSNLYEGATITKRLVIIGAGYFLPENPHTSVNSVETRIGSVYFNAGSSGSQLIGVSVTNANGIDINTSDITIKRCKIDYDIALTSNISNIKIVQTFFTNVSTGTAISASANGFPSDVIVNNNIFKKPLIIDYYNAAYTISECKNNVFAYPTTGLAIKLYAAVFENNILTNPNATTSINGGSFNNVSYNVSASANNQFGTTNNNIVVANFSIWFTTVPTPASADKDYLLKAGTTPGSDGTDRGPFGGAAISNRYTLSGLAPIPVIYQINTTGVATPAALLPVTIKARTIQ